MVGGARITVSVGGGPARDHVAGTIARSFFEILIEGDADIGTGCAHLQGRPVAELAVSANSTKTDDVFRVKVKAINGIGRRDRV